jgi:hypothetical protein
VCGISGQEACAIDVVEPNHSVLVGLPNYENSGRCAGISLYSTLKATRTCKNLDLPGSFIITQRSLYPGIRHKSYNRSRLLLARLWGHPVQKYLIGKPRTWRLQNVQLSLASYNFSVFKTSSGYTESQSAQQRKIRPKDSF